MKNSHRSFLILALIIVVGLVIFAAHSKPHQPAGSDQSGSASSNGTVATDTAAWKTYSDPKLGYSIKYPADMVRKDLVELDGISGSQSLTLWFPADPYFSTVLKDEAVVGVSASTTCFVIEAGPTPPAPQTVMANGNSFTKRETDDVAAGNRYKIISYDVLHNSLCYRITFFDHGANGAGLYESDPAKIQTDDAIHDAQLAYVMDLADAMVGTFSFSQASSTVPSGN